MYVPCLLSLSSSPHVTPDGLELVIIIIATFAQAVSGTADAVKIIGVLVVWRFLVSLCLFFFLIHPFIRSLHPLRWALVLAVIIL